MSLIIYQIYQISMFYQLVIKIINQIAFLLNYILNGTKRIELRLYDEKRQQIKIGDIIKFYKEPKLKDTFRAKVIGLLRYNSFYDMFKDLDISILADVSMTKNELMDELCRFYTVDNQLKYGVIGIRIELL